MKKSLTLFFAALCIACGSQAQAPFSTTDSVNINRLTASVLVHGDMWWDPATDQARCDFPTGSGKSCNFAGSVWLSGYDNAGGLHVAAQTYRQDGNDYWPGPLDASDTLTYASAHDWAKIWKINLSEIDAFRALPTHTIAGTPASILTWPGRGNTYAQGNAGAPLTITTDMAPFEDLNGNGIYEPLLGEYPAIRGQQALWWVFSDNGPTHSQTNGKPVKAEVHCMSYGYSRGTLIDNVVYYDYQVFNRSSDDYHNFRFAQWNDCDLGFHYDDFIGFDSTHRMGIVYNGTSCDGCASGRPPGSYGENPPQTGVTMIVLPGDVGDNYVPPGIFSTISFDAGIPAAPWDIEANLLMRTNVHDTAHYRWPDVNYLYPGDPSDPSQWSECTSGNNPHDEHFVLSSADFTLHAGEAAHVLLALVVADSAGSCGATNFSKIKEVADTAWGNYHHEVSVKSVQPGNGLRLYPNPVHDVLTIEAPQSFASLPLIKVCNVVGQPLQLLWQRHGNGWQSDISALPAGLYMLQYGDQTRGTTAKFVKE